MDPHVIFNNFNSLYSISLYKPEYLKTTVKKLKSVLHYLFRESRNEKVLLSREVAMIENYIGLEELRFGDRLQISFAIQGDAANSVSRRMGGGRTRNRESGTENSIRRLEIQYPNSHRLTIMDRQQEHVVELHIRL
jgi:hypothetical protein